MATLGMYRKLWTIGSILCTLALVQGYMQELILYEHETEEGNSFLFTTQVPDTSIYNFGNVKRVCFRGQWMFHDTLNYSWYPTYNGSASWVCQNETFDWLSFRHSGASNTDEDAISLYDNFWSIGQEIFVNTSPYSIDRNVSIRSVTNTGRSSWLLFEGPNFDGNTYCLQGTLAEVGYGGAGNMQTRNMTNVRSVLKGCPDILDDNFLARVRETYGTSRNHS